MPGDDRSPGRLEHRSDARKEHRSNAPWWLALLVVPFVVAACVTVTQSGPGAALPSPTVSASLPVAVGSASLPLLPTPTPQPTPSPSAPPVAAEVVGFLPYWLTDEAQAAIDPDLLTVLAFHGIEASGDGRLVSKKPSGDVPGGWAAMEGDAFRALQAELQTAGVKVVPSIQRFGWTEGPLKRTKNLLTNEKNRRALADRIAKLVDERGFDGINLDFEPMPTSLSDEYVELVREVRTALDGVRPGLYLSVDVGTDLSGYDLAALTADDAADVAIIMGYNYRGAGARVPGSGAPLHDPSGNDLATTVQAALAEVSPDRLVLALPWYGKAWATETDEAGSATIRGSDVGDPAEPHYADAIDLAAKYGRRYQPEQASAWTAYPDRPCGKCPPVWRQTWYEDPESFGTKVGFALDEGLAGVGIWALGQEAGESVMWQALRDELRPQEDTSPPNGSASIDPELVIGDHEDLPVVAGSAPLRLFAADDRDGSGILLARIGLSDALDSDGRLTLGRSYPAVDRIDFPLGDESTGGSSEPGPRAVHVQWRDIAGNWSAPVTIEVWAQDPQGLPTPADLQP